MLKCTYVLILAAAVSACATAPAPKEPDSLASAWVVVGDASAEHRMTPSNRPHFSNEDDSSHPPKRLYWFLAGR